MNKKKILILDGQTVQALPFMNSLKSKGYHIIIFCHTKSSYGYKSKFVDEKIICPKWAVDPNEFTRFFFEYVNNNYVDVVIPMNDDSATFLSYNKNKIHDLKINCVIPDYKTFMSGFNKNKLMTLCSELALPHPKTADLENISLEEAVKITGFPAIIKPNITAGGRGMQIIRSLEKLKEVFPHVRKEYGQCHLQQFIPPGGSQYKVQLFVDQKGIEITSVLEKIRYYPEKGGSSACNKTITKPELVDQCRTILSELNWIGFADFDLIGDPVEGNVKFMEMNPRVPACIRASIESGIDFAEIITNYSLNKPILNYTYEPGKYLRYFGLDLLWFLKSKNRFKTKPSWFNFFGKNVYYQDGSFKDPVPFIYGTLSSVGKLLNPKFRKAKSGLN